MTKSIKDFIKKTKNFSKNVQQAINNSIREVAIKGVENIKNELSKEKQQDVNVVYTIKDNCVLFSISSKTQQIKEEDLSKKEVLKFKKVLGNVPIEMLFEQSNEQNFSKSAINRAMERTQQDTKKIVDKAIQNIL